MFEKRTIRDFLNGEKVWTSVTDFSIWYSEHIVNKHIMLPKDLVMDLVITLHERFDLRSTEKILVENSPFIYSVVQHISGRKDAVLDVDANCNLHIHFDNSEAIVLHYNKESGIFEV